MGNKLSKEEKDDLYVEAYDEYWQLTGLTYLKDIIISKYWQLRKELEELEKQETIPFDAERIKDKGRQLLKERKHAK